MKQQQHWKLVEAARVIYSAGFFITVSPESILAVAKHCTEQGKIYCMNLSAPFISEVSLPQTGQEAGLGRRSAAAAVCEEANCLHAGAVQIEHSTSMPQQQAFGSMQPLTTAEICRLRCSLCAI